VRGEVFNIGSTEENYRKREIVDLVRRHASDAAVEFVHKEEDPRDYRVSFAKVKENLDFAITRTVPDGIAEVARLVRDGVLCDLDGPEYRN
jgi:nucleoside-diphosphate-sugar epimerase